MKTVSKVDNDVVANSDNDVKHSIKCPFCNGLGEIEAPEFRNKLLEEKRIAAQTLRTQGYSIREIMKIMKYKSPRSVHILIHRQ